MQTMSAISSPNIWTIAQIRMPNLHSNLAFTPPPQYSLSLNGTAPPNLLPQHATPHASSAPPPPPLPRQLEVWRNRL